jgi:hypothetical protein
MSDPIWDLDKLEIPNHLRLPNIKNLTINPNCPDKCRTNLDPKRFNEKAIKTNTKIIIHQGYPIRLGPLTIKRPLFINLRKWIQLIL